MNLYKTLINENKTLECYAADFKASDLSSGIYFRAPTSNGLVLIKKY